MARVAARPEKKVKQSQEISTAGKEMLPPKKPVILQGVIL